MVESKLCKNCKLGQFIRNGGYFQAPDRSMYEKVTGDGIIRACVTISDEWEEKLIADSNSSCEFPARFVAKDVLTVE